ncbi:MAG: hypothetical protein IPL95_16725 [Saprospiraceae bacterium]|nr:hypothetical protein [Saprospiraceae bacterium]
MPSNASTKAELKKLITNGLPDDYWNDKLFKYMNDPRPTLEKYNDGATYATLKYRLSTLYEEILKMAETNLC